MKEQKNLSKKEAFSLQFLQILDVIMIFIALILSVHIRNLLLPVLENIPYLRLDAPEGMRLTSVSTLIYVTPPFIVVILEAFGFYNNGFQNSLKRNLGQIVKAGILTMVVFAVASLVFKLPPQNRGYLAISGVLLTGALLFRSWAYRKYQAVKLTKDHLKDSIIVIGLSESIDEWFSEKKELSERLYNVEESININEQTMDEIEAVLIDKSICKVIILPRKIEFDRVASLIKICEQVGIESCVNANFIESRIASPAFETVLDVPMLVLRTTPVDSWSILVKKILDRVIALAGIIISSPLWIMAAVGIYLSDRGPIFFRQERAGKYGKPFKMLKFRTMCLDAEAKLQALKESQGNQMSGPVFKLDYDPRVFKFGAWLRKTSIDELPQLLNVLLGDMSMVGPRPMAMYELPEIEKSSQRRKMSVKPGITCIWQVEGRNTITDFEEWVQLDLKYIDNWSLWLDFKILIKTLPAVLFSRGAK